ncbi:MAG: di-heme oxidoredictase family protein [Bauldia sp.]
MTKAPFAALLGLAGIAVFAAGAGVGAGTLRDALIATPVTPDLGGDTTIANATAQAYTQLSPNAPADRQRAFTFGDRLFLTEWAEYPGSAQAFDGLGPTFNRNSCSGCHVRNGRGRSPDKPGDPMDSMLIRLSAADGAPHPAYGDQLNDRAILGVAPEGRAIIDTEEIAGRFGDGTPYTLLEPRVRFADLAYGPLDDALTSPRVAPAVIGMGLLEAVPVATLEALDDPDDRDGDGISGRINWLTDGKGKRVPGRLGWKANVATIAEQAAGAAVGDIGITTGLRPKQNCPAPQASCRAAAADPGPEMSDSFFDRLVIYMRTLAVPEARGLDRPLARQGAAVFRDLGCAACHIPTLTTGPDAPLPELAGQTSHPFTDLLVHDMGEGLADHRPDGAASGSEWRTPPLWGIGLLGVVNGHDRLLHDGRARGLAEAILWHGGEAEKAREAFRNAPAGEREALIAFLGAL